jgi:hypothetical protein
MRGKKFKDTNLAAVVALSMPELKHGIEPFDWSTSEVCQWILAQPEAANYLFYKLRDVGAIVFDPETETWKGSES